MIRKIYEVDPLVCASCRGEMLILSFILDPAVVREILDHLGHSCLPPARAPLPSAAVHSQHLFAGLPVVDVSTPAMPIEIGLPDGFLALDVAARER